MILGENQHAIQKFPIVRGKDVEYKKLFNYRPG